MGLDLSALERAISSLERSLEYMRSDLAAEDPGLREQFQQAAVQAFEFTYELLGKFLRRRLATLLATPSQLSEMAFMDIVRQGADAGLVRDVAAFRRYRVLRNLTSHTYNPTEAARVVAALEDFLLDARFLLDALKRQESA